MSVEGVACSDEATKNYQYGPHQPYGAFIVFQLLVLVLRPATGLFVSTLISLIA